MPIPRNALGSVRSSRARPRKGRALLVLAAAAVFGGLAGLVLLRNDTQSAAAALSAAPPMPTESADGAVAATALPQLPSLGPSLGGLWAVLAVFVALGVATILVARRAGGRRTGNGAVHLVDSLSLGGRRMVHLIRCGPRRYLIGNSEQGIQYLASLPAEAHETAIDETLDTEPRIDAVTGGEAPFASLLRGAGRPS